MSDATKKQLPAIIDRIKEKLAQKHARPMAGELWTATFVLLGMKFDRALAHQLLRGITAMEESTTYQYIIELGEAKGREKGRTEGAIEEARHMLFLVGEKRLGPPSSIVKSAVNAIMDRQQLERLVSRALEVATWQELLNLPSGGGRPRRKRPT